MRIGWVTDTVTTDASRALHYTLLWGLDGVVLRTIGKAGERVPFINEGAIRRRLEAEDVSVLAIAPGLFEGDTASRASWMNDVDAFEETAAFCTRLGVQRILTGALAGDPDAFDESVAADALRRLGDLADRAGLHLAVRNESGTAVATGTALASLLHRVDHSAVQADWRPLDAALAGEDPAVGLAALQAVAPVMCMTVRDQAEDGTPAVPGDGRVDWEAQLRTIQTAGEDTAVILEIHGRPSGTFGLHMASAVISAVRRAKRSNSA